MIMFKNYFKVGIRNLMKNKVFSFINILGLAIGLTCCMLISLYLNNEFSYDTYHKNADRIYQVGTAFIKDGKEERRANTPAPMARAMQMEFPEIEQTTRLMKAFADDKTLLLYTPPSGERKSFFETGGYLADSTFFRLLTYDFIEGMASNALDQPNSLVLSEEIAKKLFGSEIALNKVIHISSATNGEHDFKVTGVFRPSGVPTHIDARFIMSFAGGDIALWSNGRTDLATNNMFHTYLLLKKGSDPAKLESKFPAFIEKYAGKDLKAMGFYKKQFIIPLKDIHLRSTSITNVTPPGNLSYLYILGSIAVFILLIACINFMNLSTARSSKRSAEVGVRKVLGAEKGELIRQFLGESIIMSMIAFVFALVFTQLLLPVFTKVSGNKAGFEFIQHGLLLGGFFLLTIITGLLAGSYPAFYLSSFKPVKVLKGKLTNSLAAVSLRKSLVVFQFVISVILIVASVVIVNQMKFMRTKDLGFVKEQQLIIPLRSSTARNIYLPLKNELKSNPHIVSAGATRYYPGTMHPSDMPLYMEGKTMDYSKRVFMNSVDADYLEALGIKQINGRPFSRDFLSDTIDRVILNQTAVKEIGFTSAEEAVTKSVKYDWEGRTYSIEVLGVVKDFHFQDLRQPIEPYGFRLGGDSSFSYIIAHLKNGDLKKTLNSVEASWHKLNPNEPFEYSFLDEDFQKNYEAESRLSAIVSYFTILAILISCLGLFGLGTFSAEQRNKEIGIRKVLGASVPGIVALLSKDFLKLVIISIVIASPIAWWIMNKWLQDFAFRVNISWWIFMVAGIAAIFITLVTVSFQAIKAAVSNPVKSLRTE